MAPAVEDPPVEEQGLYVSLRIGELRARYRYDPTLKKYFTMDNAKRLSPSAMQTVIVKWCRSHGGGHWSIGVPLAQRKGMLHDAADPRRQPA